MSSSNPFDEEVDDAAFLSAPRSGYSLEPSGSSSRSTTSYRDQHQQILDERKRLEQQTLQSTKNSMALIYETEKVGLATAEELLHQREQLEQIDEKLDNINSVMRVSQKHLTSMKSLFGGFRNYFSKDKTKEIPKGLSHSSTDSKLSTTVHSIRNQTENVSNQMNHPSLRDKASMYDESPKPTASRSDQNLSAYDQHSKDIDAQLDDNLAEMGMGIGRLKELALGLGNEIDSQSGLIDRIATKNERAQDNIEHQNRQMKKILKS